MLAVMAGLASPASAEPVDLGKPFQADNDTICLFHLDDVADGVVKDSVAGGKPGKVAKPTTAEGKFAGALSCDGDKGHADVAGLDKMEGLRTLTVECWVKFRSQAVGDVVCRGGQYMIRVSTSVTASFWIDGAWRNVTGDRAVPVDRWTHLAITWDQGTMKAGIYLDGRLDVRRTPEGVTDGVLGGGLNTLRLGGHTWQSPAPNLNGLLDEVRVSLVVREYRPLPGSEKDESAATPGPGRTARAGVSEASAQAETTVSTFVFPWGNNAHPTDTPKSHVQEITKGTQTYRVPQGGTMDGRNCRTPMGVGMNSEGAFFRPWESNRSARMENVGDTDVVNPWLSNGRNTFRNVAEIVQSAITPEMTEAGKAFAIWFQQIRHRHHSGGDNNELGDPVKVFNVYGFNTCGNDSICLGTLWKQAGLRTAPARALGHCISQVFYDGAWHLLDGDLHSVYLLRDNETVANDAQLARDHDLVKRTHSNGILLVDTQWDGQGTAALYFTECEITGQRSGKADTRMNMVLRPGEAIVWRWGQLKPLKHHTALYTMPTYTGAIFNGLWEYRPDLSKPLWRQGATSVENIRWGGSELTAEEGKTGSIVWTMSSPYVFVGGRIEAEGSGARFFICQDGKRWQAVSGPSLDRFFSIVGPPYYKYQVKCELGAGASLNKVAIINDLQMAPMALPEMVVGENSFTYSDETPGTRAVRITHQWVERSATRSPAAPEAVYPADGGESDGTDIVFKWTVPTDPDRDSISDYQFELSRRADVRFPLSMSFYKLSSRTLDASRTWTEHGFKFSEVKPQYTLSEPGLLTPDTKYYWHVRAMDTNGLWGPWSKTFSFTARGAAYPLDVKVVWDEAKGVGTLSWKANPVGRRPTKYRVYGSDEKGFTVMDKPRQLDLGISAKNEMAAWNPWAPPNFIAETSDTQLAVIGPDINPAGNKTYYRVVAVDERDKRSGPSDYAVGPRPVIYTKPQVTAKVGQEYKYKVSANRSLGDLSARMQGGNQVAGYFDIEKPKFTLAQGPAWLKIDEATGILSGTPEAAGKVEVAVTVTIDRQLRKLDEKALVWGREEVLSTATERVGAATQKFVIDVQPRDVDAEPRKAGKKVKIFMHWDMEGASGLFRRDQAWYWEEGIRPQAAEEGRALLLEDVNSAVRAALDAGVDELIVCDTHHGGGNLRRDRLIPDPRVTYLERSVGLQDGKRRWMPGLDGSIDGLMLMAHHAKAGTEGAFLPHTQNLDWTDFRINGQSLGEIGIETCYAGHWDVPLILVQGDEAACREAEKRFPGVITAAVKRAEDRDTSSGLDAEAARRLTARRVAEAIQKLRASGFAPFKPTLPMTVVIRFTTSDAATAAAAKRGVRRIDELTVEAQVPRQCDVIQWISGHGLDMPEASRR
jgi:D-amino peptidase